MSWDLFQGAIPGESLTKELGSNPTELPSQFADPNDALEYLMDKLTEPRQVTRLVLMLKKDVPVEYIARAVVFQGFSTGKWTPDVGMLMVRIVIAMIIAIATQKGVSPKIFNPDKEQDEFLDQFLDMAEEPSAPAGLGEQTGGGLTGLPSEFTGLLGTQL